MVAARVTSESSTSKIRSEIPGSFETCFWRRIENIIWTDRVRNEVLHRIKERRNIQPTIKGRKIKYFGHILRRNYFLKHVTKRNIEGSISKQLLDDYKGKGGYWNLALEEATDVS